MKILAYIAALNDETIIGDCIKGLLSQTCPVSEILVVDNGSSDGTAYNAFLKDVTIIRHVENRGTSGAAVTAFKYAISKGYDWVWVFDADSVAHEDALEKLMELYRSFSPEFQSEIWLLASLPVEVRSQKPYHGITFTRKGMSYAAPKPGQTFYECDATMWTGSLYRLSAIQKIGLPLEDYFLDWGDIEYGYKGKMAGLKCFMSQLSIIDHNLHTIPTLRSYQLGPLSFRMFRSPPIRRYYYFRNGLYFWLHEYQDGNFFTVFLPYLYGLTKILVKCLLVTEHPLQELSACARGIWDGFAKKLHRRY